MSYYDVYGTLTAEVPSVELAKNVLRHYVMILSNEAETSIFRYSGQMDAGATISLRAAPAIKLTEREALIMDALGSLDNYAEHAYEIFSARLLAAGSSQDEVWDFLSELYHYSEFSSIDVISEMGIDDFLLECHVSSSQNIYNGDAVQMPGGTLVIKESYSRNGVNAEKVYALKSQEKIVNLNDSLFDGLEYNFEDMESLLWSSVATCSINSDLVKFPTFTTNELSYDYKMTTIFGKGELTTHFKYKALENKRGRGKKNFPLHATVTISGMELWSGTDPIGLKNVLNQWCHSA